MKLLILDKDGTIVYPTHGQFVDAPWHQARIDGISALLNRYVVDGWCLAIASNQAGIEKGYKSLSDAFLEFRYCLELYPQIMEAYFCPNFSGGECWRVWNDCSESYRIRYSDGRNYRKPGPGMLQLAMEIHSPDEVLYVGDRSEDEGAATSAGIPFMLAEAFLRS